MIEEAPFDSSHYGLKIGRLSLSRATELDDNLARARAAGFVLLFMRADETLAAELAARGVPSIETLVVSTLSRRALAQLAPQSKNPDVVVSAHSALTDPAEIATIARMTGSAFSSHLHADPRLPVERTTQLFEDWARNDVCGRAYRTLVARIDNEIAGYLTIVPYGTATARIDLIVASPRWRGRGVGTALLTSYVDWLRSQPYDGFVGTQSNNPALALYARFGFVRSQVLSEYHLWLDDAG